MFDHSEQVNELAAALAKAQAKFSNPLKSNTAKVKTKAGAEYKYNYADQASILEAIRAPLAENGLSVIQPSDITGAIVSVETILLHASGQFMSCGIVRVTASDTLPQSIGSALTYCEKYGLKAIGVVSEEDDDGEGAMDRKQKPKKETTKPGQSLLCQNALAALEKIDDGISLAEWRIKFNKAAKEKRFIDSEVEELEGAYALKADKMSEGHHD